MTGFWEGKPTFEDRNCWEIDHYWEIDSEMYLLFPENICIKILTPKILTATQEKFFGDKEWDFESGTFLYFFPFYENTFSGAAPWVFQKAEDENRIIKSDVDFSKIVLGDKTFLEPKDLEVINNFFEVLKSNFQLALDKSEEVLKERDNLFMTLDADNNGIIDIAEGEDDIKNLLINFQSENIQIQDDTYNSCLKLSRYLKDRKENKLNAF